MNDDDGISDEYKQKIYVGTCEILHVLGQFETADEALNALASATTYILCNGVSSKIEAGTAYNNLCGVIGEALKNADEIGETAWHKGLYH